jgi:mRNA interferase MazF
MKQGDIWLVDLDPTRGAEIQKVRPVVIVNNNSLGKLPLKIIVPITDWKDRYEIASWMIRIQPNRQNGLLKSLRQTVSKLEVSHKIDLSRE